MYEKVVPGTFFDPLVAALIRYLVGDTVADWLEVPRSNWDSIAKVVPVALDAAERIEDSGPIGEWILDRLGGLVSNLELTSLTRGRIMHYAVPDHLKSEYGVAPLDGKARWSPPPPAPEA